MPGRMLWQSRPGPPMRRTLKQARATYVCGDYRIVWHGSTHGIWALSYKGALDSVHSLLTDAKQRAEDHKNLMEAFGHAGR